MIISINNIEITLPGNVSEITLGQRIEYDVQYGNDISEAIKEITSNEKLSEEEAQEQLAPIYIDQAQKALSYFADIELPTVQKFSIGDVVVMYETHVKSLVELPNEREETNSFLINEKLYWLPESTLTPTSTFTFNEFITSKEITRNMNSTSSDKLNAAAYLGAMFFRPMNEVFSESDLNEDSSKIDMIYNLPITDAMQILLWYDEWSTFIATNFSVFEKSKLKGIDMSTHFDKWGWISFLNYVAKNGTIFYKSNNKSNLDNIKDANLYEVLIWASCEKDQEDIIGKYYESLERKNKKS